MLGKRSNASMSIASSVKYFSTSSTSVDARRFNPSRKRFFFGSYNGKRQPFNVFIDLLIATARWRWSYDRYRSTPFALDLALDKLVRSIARSRSQKNERSLNRSRSINRSRQLCKIRTPSDRVDNPSSYHPNYLTGNAINMFKSASKRTSLKLLKI